MEDIKLKTDFDRMFYKFSWLVFVFFGFPAPWLIAYGLYIYGPNSPENKKKIKHKLTMTYQKFILFYGLFFVGVVILIIIISIFMEMLSLL